MPGLILRRKAALAYLRAVAGDELCSEVQGRDGRARGRPHQTPSESLGLSS